MLQNYLKLTWRNLIRNSTYSFIVISGLVLAYSACLLIFLFVRNEVSYDRLSPDHDRIYRIAEHKTNDDGSIVETPTTPCGLGPALNHEVSQIESTVRVLPGWSVKSLVSHGPKSFYEERIVGADTNFVNFFGFKVIAGEPTIKDKQSLILTESTARKYFNEENPVGKAMKIEGFDYPFNVTGVIEDMPFNNHFHFDIISTIYLPASELEIWENYNYYTYVKLTPGADIASVDPQILEVFKRNRPGNLRAAFFSQPITDIHLHSNLKYELERNGDQIFVTIFITIGVFIFLIAAINYINLSIVLALNRSKEVGVRKVSGAMSGELTRQFLFESTLISIVSLVIAVFVVQGVVPIVNVIFGQHLASLFGLPFYQFVLIVFVAIAAGILSGLYPALYLSAFSPAIVLKGFLNPGSGNAWLRKTLVVTQFSISIALISGAALVFIQMNYLRSKDLGFDKDQVIIIENIWQMKNKQPLKDALMKVNGITAVGASSGVLGKQNSSQDLAAKGLNLRILANYDLVDEDFLSAVGVELVAGRNFSPSDVVAGPGEKLIINERAAMDLGIDESPIGRMLTNDPYGDSVRYREVIGVVKDFHFNSLRTEIKPYAFLLDYSNFSNFAVKTSRKDYKKLLSELSAVWAAHGSGGPFEYFFLDDQFESLYKAEENFQLIFLILTVISIYIACSGLFAVATYFIKRRRKEIGIRKALGASAEQITWLVSKGFIRMVLLANLIAWPVTWAFMDEWLNGFAYRIEMNWVIFLVAGITALLIAVFTIGGQSLKAAQSNPVESLRNE